MPTAEPESPPPPKSLPERLGEAARPLLAGLAIDLVDLATFGPLGITAGLALGAIAGWVLAPQLVENGATAAGRWSCALLGGLYCAMPGTAVLPLASVMAFVLKLSDDDQRGGTSAPTRHPDAIDVDFRRADGPVDPRDEPRG